MVWTVLVSYNCVRFYRNRSTEEEEKMRKRLILKKQKRKGVLIRFSISNFTGIANTDLITDFQELSWKVKKLKSFKKKEQIKDHSRQTDSSRKTTENNQTKKKENNILMFESLRVRFNNIAAFITKDFPTNSAMMLPKKNILA